MTKLSVNLNKIATLRNARGGDLPNLVQVAIDCQTFGADGITIHPRPDERHIKWQDVFDLLPVISTEFNIEGYPNQRFIDLCLQAKPTQATLVPDPPDVLTSNAGWDTVTHRDFLQETISELKRNNIRAAIFVDTDLVNIEGAKLVGADRVELYTESYAKNFILDKKDAIESYIVAANKSNGLDLAINAGHDLNLNNLTYFKKNIPNLLEVSIGHALISDALYFGLEKTIQLYKSCLK